MPAEFTYDALPELLVDNSVLNVISGFTEILDPGGMTVGGASVYPVCAELFEVLLLELESLLDELPAPN